jgi:TonB family protein
VTAAIAHAALAIAGALFDSFWEGALVVGAVWLGLRCLPALGAATRYAIWLCTLASLVVVPVLTVALAGETPRPVTAAPAISDVGGGAPTRAVPSLARTPPAVPEPAVVVAAGPAPQLEARKSRITVPQSLAVATAFVWILVACARVFMLVLDQRALAAVRREARLWSTADEYPVFVSERARMPLAAGFRHPGIILPASLIARLPADAVRTIVVHEVAHLRRSDVWTNALARIAEVFVALNPAAWFVMRRLSVEREIACDDWVVARTGAGDAFARVLATLASGANGRMPLGAPSALGSRHSLVERIERLLDAAPRRLRLSPPALGGALTLLALIAFALQSVSPVLAYEPQPELLAQASAAAPSSAACAAPDRGIMMAYLLGPKRRAAGSRSDDVLVPPASAVVARHGASHVVTFDLTVDAAGRPRNVVMVSPAQYPDQAQAIRRIYMASMYEPALRNCVPVTATIRTAVPSMQPESSTVAVIVPVYPAGWSARYASSCKVPTVTHARFRSGFDAPTKFGKLLPAFPDTMKFVPIGSKFATSVDVHVNAAGAATSAAVVRSSGKPAFDDAALAAVRAATYPLTDTTCTPLPTEYVWNLTFGRTTLLYRLGESALRSPARR